jgi:hypothetical protein
LLNNGRRKDNSKKQSVVPLSKSPETPKLSQKISADESYCSNEDEQSETDQDEEISEEGENYSEKS